MEFLFGSFLIAVSVFVAAVKLWMVHHAARLTERDRVVGLSSGILVPSALFMTGIYCIDGADRRLWFSWQGYLALTAGLAVILLLVHPKSGS
jgi:hypothetical protein